MPNTPDDYLEAFRSRFHPDHLADLARSGLSQDMITTLKIHSVHPDEITQHLGFPDPHITSLLCFPYPGLKRFCRDKLFPPLPDADGHCRRYHQRKGSPIHAYLPIQAQAALHEPNARILITEGEKKAAKACQDGWPTIGLGGLWNWGKAGELIEELRAISWNGRPVWVVPDSDVWLREDLLRAIYALGCTLARHGATIAILRLPPYGPEKAGLDDFLVHHGSAALHEVEQIPLHHPFFAEAAHWEPQWRTKQQPDANISSLSLITLSTNQSPQPQSTLPRFPPMAWTQPFLRWREILSQHTNAPDEFLWAAFATAWGLILARRVYIAHPITIYPNLWTLLIGPSARARKSTVLYALQLLLESLNIPYCRISGLSSIEGLAQQMADTKDQPTLLCEEEFRRLLGVATRKVTANLIPDLQRLSYCNQPFDLTRTDHLHIERPFLAFITATPLAFIEEMLTEAHFTGGFLNRFLLLHGEPNAPLALPPPLTTTALTPLTTFLQNLIGALPTTSTLLSLTGEARKMYTTWYDSWDTQLQPLPEHLQQLLVRLPEHALKLSLIYATLEGVQTITPAQLAPPLAIVDYVQTLTLHHFQHVSLSHTARIEERVYGCITKGKYIARDIKHYLGGRVSTQDMNRALDALVKSERLLKTQARTGKNRAIFRYTLPQD